MKNEAPKSTLSEDCAVKIQRIQKFGTDFVTQLSDKQITLLFEKPKVFEATVGSNLGHLLSRFRRKLTLLLFCTSASFVSQIF